MIIDEKSNADLLHKLPQQDLSRHLLAYDSRSQMDSDAADVPLDVAVATDGIQIDLHQVELGDDDDLPARGPAHHRNGAPMVRYPYDAVCWKDQKVAVEKLSQSRGERHPSFLVVQLVYPS